MTVDTATASPRAMALGFFEDINVGRFEAAFARLAEDVRYEVIAPPPYGGQFDRDGLGKFVAENVAPRLDGPMAIEIIGVTASGDRVAIETEIEAPAKGGGAYNNRFHFLFVVRDSQIVEVREYLDSAAFVSFVTGQLN